MSERLSRRTKLVCGFGDTGFSLTSTILGAYFAIFLTDVIGIRPGIAAIAIFIGRSWDYINDPIFGHLSDRTRTRWGRRRPYLLFGMLPLVITFSMLWWKPPWENAIALAAYYSVAYVLFEAANTLLYMPYFALTPELTLDYDERTALTSYRMFFSIAAGLVAFTIPLMLVGSFAPQSAPRVLAMGLIFGSIPTRNDEHIVIPGKLLHALSEIAGCCCIQPVYFCVQNTRGSRQCGTLLIDRHLTRYGVGHNRIAHFYPLWRRPDQRSGLFHTNSKESIHNPISVLVLLLINHDSVKCYRSRS